MKMERYFILDNMKHIMIINLVTEWSMDIKLYCYSFRQFERVPDVLNRAYMGDMEYMEYMDIYGVYMGQIGSFVFILPFSYEGNTSNMEKYEEEYVIYMEGK